MEIDKSLAKVQRIQGKYVFVHSEPVNDYDVAFDVATLFIIVTSTKIESQVAAVISKALKIGHNDRKEFDGVIFGIDNKQTAIKFKQ